MAEWSAGALREFSFARGDVCCDEGGWSGCLMLLLLLRRIGVELVRAVQRLGGFDVVNESRGSKVLSQARTGTWRWRKTDVAGDGS